MAEMSPLRRRMIEDMTVRNLSPATQRSYVYAVAKFSRYFGRSPDRLGLEDVRAFQVHLVATGISWPALNQTVCALRFFYGVTLGQGEIPERIPYAREPRKLPVVLSADEVVRFLEAVPSLKTRAALTTAYAAGLRASEVGRLKVADIDSGRMVIRVEHGKGGKDRYVMLSAQLLRILRTYWRLARPQHWLFPGRDESADRPTCCRRPAARPARRPAWASRSRCTRCGTASPRICWRAAPISASSRCCSATPTCRPRRATRGSRPRSSATRRARSTGYAGGRAARLSAAPWPGSGGGGYLPPPRRRLSSGPCRPSGPRRAARDERHRACRTAALGGHVEQCVDCGRIRIAYNSCRNRHCPKCQGLARAEWLADRQAELLPVPYFHVVFTLPAPVAEIAFQNKAAVYAILFRAAAETLRTIAADPKHLGAEIGLVAVLHTWGQNLHHHPHVHCVVPGGGLSPDGTRWVACRPGFFLPVRVLSRLFRRLFLEELQAAFDAGELGFFGELAALAEPAAFARRLRPNCGGSTGWSTPSRPSADRSRCSPISAATPIASPSPTAAWSA